MHASVCMVIQLVCSLLKNIISLFWGKLSLLRFYKIPQEAPLTRSNLALFSEWRKKLNTKNSNMTFGTESPSTSVSAAPPSCVCAPVPIRYLMLSVTKPIRDVLLQLCHWSEQIRKSGRVHSWVCEQCDFALYLPSTLTCFRMLWSFLLLL